MAAEHPWLMASAHAVVPAAELRTPSRPRAGAPQRARRAPSQRSRPSATPSDRQVETAGGLTRADVMSVREVADLLDITPRTVYRLVREGQLPGARRIGRTVVVVRPVFEHWLLTGSKTVE